MSKLLYLLYDPNDLNGWGFLVTLNLPSKQLNYLSGSLDGSQIPFNHGLAFAPQLPGRKD
jgi:hypothetical protein